VDIAVVHSRVPEAVAVEPRATEKLFVALAEAPKARALAPEATAPEPKAAEFSPKALAEMPMAVA